MRGLTLVAACGALTFAACGEDDETSGGGGDSGGEPKALAIEMTESAPGKLAVTAPTTAEAGVVKIDFKNSTKLPAGAQLVKVDGDETAEQVVKEIFDTEDGAPTPPWAHGAGGVGDTPPGASGTATQVLEAGTYHLVAQQDTEEESTKPALATIKVDGEGGGELPDAPASITAEEYGFATEGLKAGKNTVKFDNVGDELHHVVAAPLAPDATIEDVKKFLATEGEPQGPPPLDFEQERSTAVLDGKTAQVTDLELQKGKNVLLCFISDRAGGPPHIAKGMISEVDIP